MIDRRLVLTLGALMVTLVVESQTPRFRMLVLAERDPNHTAFVEAARPWLDSLAAAEGFVAEYHESPSHVSDEFLSHFDVVFQMNYPPYRWSDSAKAAFERYIEQGRGGWVGTHHATLLGEFDGYAMWPWFSDFMGSIRFKDYIATFASGKVNVEDRNHPVTMNIPRTFRIEKEEWYTYDRSPRPRVHVLASVDESSYQPGSDKKMGDHPVVWTNPRMKARNVYIFMGHDPILFSNASYKQMLRNALMWAGAR